MNTIIQLNKQDLVDLFKEVVTQIESIEKKDRYLTFKEASQMTGKTRSSLWAWEKKGYLVPTRIGRELRYLESDILKLMSKKGEK